MFLFKQETAYEMRISDWSSDVCSSDLHPQGCPRAHPRLCRQGPALCRPGRCRGLPTQSLQWLRRLERCAVAPPDGNLDPPGQTGRASCRERGCHYVFILVFTVPLKIINMTPAHLVTHTTQQK